MRIRKNRKLSYAVGSGSSLETQQQQPHFCQLNQSPWDAICFSQDSVFLFETQNSFDGNETFGDFIPGADREKEEAPTTNKGLKLVSEIEEESKFKFNIVESNVNENWKQRNKEANSICGHDLMYQKFSGIIDYGGCCLGLVNPQINNKTDKRSIVEAHKEVKTIKAGKRERYLSSNTQEFYYYSGFGPLWGKKKDRGDQGSTSKSSSVNTGRLISGASNVKASFN